MKKKKKINFLRKTLGTKKRNLSITKKKKINVLRNTTGNKKDFISPFKSLKQKEEINNKKNICLKSEIFSQIKNQKNLKLYLSDFKQNNKIDENPRNIIKINFISNWGSNKYIGLNEIKIFDKNLKEIMIYPYNIKIFKNNKEINFSNEKLINNSIKSNEANDMFVLPFNDKILYSIEIEISNKPSFLLIWNFNQDLRVGLKNCKIYFLKKKVFQGEIFKGSGIKYDESYFSIIKLSYNSNFSDIKKKMYQKFTNDENSQISLISRKKTSKSKVKNKSKEKIKKQFENNIFLTQIKNDKLSAKNIEKKRISINLNENKYEEKIEKDELKEKKYEHNEINIKKKSFFIKKKMINNFNMYKNDFTANYNKNINNSQLLNQDSNKKLKNLQSEEKKDINILPKLNGLTFIILNSWGDKNFTGLFRIEIFNSKGKLVHIRSFGVFDDKKNKIKTNLNVLIKKIVFSKSKNEHWLCPFQKTSKILIKFKFSKKEEISMIRIWNYNTSRTDLTKCVKDLQITSLKNKDLIFSGSIKYASGSLKYHHHNYENILFSENKEILKNIALNDSLFKYLNSKKKKISEIKINQRYNDFLQKRPITVEKKIKSKRNKSFRGKFLDKNKIIKHNFNKKISIKENTEKNYVEFKSLKLEIIENWGDKKEFGFSGIEFYDEENNKISIIFYNIKLSNTKQYSQNIINRLKKMKPTFFHFKRKKSKVEYLFKEKMKIKKINLFNINENYSLNKTGVKLINIYFDNKKINKEIVCIKKGNNTKEKSLTQINFPLNQTSNFFKLIKTNKNNFLSGFTIKFHLKTTFGDPYYIGLNEIEIFDIKGQNILKKNKNKIKANPEGVFVLDRMEDDKRRVENLKNGILISDKYKDIWLTPLIKFKIQKKKNIIIIDFEKPFILGMINIWNYSKYFLRSVREIDILFDDHLIFSGELNNPKKENLNSIIFCENTVNNLGPCVQVNKIKNNECEIIQLVDEGIIWQKSVKDEEIFHGYRPLTGLDPS